MVLYLSPFHAPSHALTVGGQHSKFTLLCMSYDARMATLRHFVRHYSRCPSVSDIVIAWNKGEPGRLERRALGWAVAAHANRSCNEPPHQPLPAVRRASGA